MMPLDLRALQELIERDGRVLALFVTGSHAEDRADEHSDLDLLAVTSEAEVQALADELPTVLNEIAPLVDAAVRPLGSSVLVNIVTDRCQRIDVVVAGRDAVAQTPRFGATRRVFDRADIESTLPPVSDPLTLVRGEAWFDALVRGVLRTVALLPMIVVREEYIRGAQHVQLLKQDYLELLLFAEGDPPVTRPGMWAWSELNDRLSLERRSQVAALPAAGTTGAEVIRGHHAVLEAFLVTARQVAQRSDIVWKHSAYEKAVAEYLSRSGCSA